MTFTKLFTSITDSTIWQEDDHTRLVWITMLAMADRNGRVFASIPGLASRARVPLQSVEKALQRFSSPDSYSRTPDHEGRRIEPIEGSWRLLNHAKYRDLRDEEVVRESKRRYINERRRREREARQVGVEQSVENVDRCRLNAEADTEAGTISKRKSSTSKPRRSLEDPSISEKRRLFIRKLNELARANPHALLPVEFYSEEVEKALNLHESDDFKDLTETIEQEIRSFNGPPQKRLSLVRLVWEAY